jgi:3-isopropylmalate/(R)-2-methylmalate dehydratase large subunit
MRLNVEGRLPDGIYSKDIILALIGRIGAAGAIGYAIEYAGSAIRALSMDARLTVCNMSIEAGARCGMIAPDDTAYEYLARRPYAPKGPSWDRALALWRALPSDLDTKFDTDISFAADALAPMVTWGTSPEHVVPVTGVVPDPAHEKNPVRRCGMEQALRYMDLAPGAVLEGLSIDHVFIGSCTNGRLEDLRIAAEIARGARAVIPAFVVPGSGLVKQEAESEGLDRIFKDGCRI